ncbi:MAG: hypothetical protein ACR2P0_03245 [Acidimicrobiales bacterium]
MGVLRFGVAVLALAVVGCSSSEASSASATDDVLIEPLLVEELNGSFSNWANFETRADGAVLVYRLSYCEPPDDCEESVVDQLGRALGGTGLDSLGERVGPVRTYTDDAPTPAGFNAFNNPAVALADGRVLLRGMWDGDEPIESWRQRNPDAVAPGEDPPPVIDEALLPVRLFVFDPAADTLQPVSHEPEVRSFSTAISQGSGPDVVLDLVVLSGDATVAYTVGFNGAGYDIPYALYLAPIPPRG